MTATFTNLPKNTPSFTSKIKGYAQQAIYGVGVYGIALYGVGTSGFGTITNRTKSTIPLTTIYAGTPMGLLLTLTYANDITVGGGVTNQSKS